VSAPSATGLPSDIAIVHDYLNQRGGAERVVLEMASMWPGAPVYTSLYRPESTFPEFRALDVRTSFLDRAPVDRGFRRLFPLYPAAFRSLGSIGASVVVSSSSGWAHGVRTPSNALHAVYCHTPARWLYGDEHLDHGRATRLIAPMMRPFRTWDRKAARRADLYLANSEQVRRRIAAEYGIDAVVVHPPVDVDRFTPCPRGDRLLVVSRLLPYKRVDLVVDAATQAGIGLDVVGTGPALNDLRDRAGPAVRFHGRLTDADVTALMQSCRAFCVPGNEDFGITAIEANAAGKPVVALAKGGALETLEDSVTASFFHEQRPDDVLAAIRRSDTIDTEPAVIASYARRFSQQAFRERMTQALVVGFHRLRAGTRST
jgi:glycosyltransferase involved in cell wall biosynthesis